MTLIVSFLIHFTMKANIHNFKRKKNIDFISEIEMHCMFTNERKKKLIKMHA